jgi:hypothetical protein
VGDIISFWWAASFRYDGRHHLVLVGGFARNQQLSDLYPETYPTADGYVTREPLDASDVEHLTDALALAGGDCTAIVTNTPHNTQEACASSRT